MSIQLAASGHHVFTMRRYLKGGRSPVSEGGMEGGEVVMSATNIRPLRDLHQQEWFPSCRATEKNVVAGSPEMGQSAEDRWSMDPHARGRG
jgi:hypothetical protein